MVMYHGTIEANLEQILMRGLLPRDEAGRESTWGTHIASREGFVYLSECLDWRYAFHAAVEHHHRTGEFSSPMLVEVNVGVDHLCPDEDFVAKSVAVLQGVGQAVVHDAITGEVMRQYRQEWRASLGVYGSVAHDGPILPKQVRRILLLDPNQLLVGIDDLLEISPHINMGSLDEYAGPVGQQSRQVHRLLWGEVSVADDVPHRVAPDGRVLLVAEHVTIPSGTRRFLTVKHGEVVHDRVA